MRGLYRKAKSSGRQKDENGVDEEKESYGMDAFVLLAAQSSAAQSVGSGCRNGFAVAGPKSVASNAAEQTSRRWSSATKIDWSPANL